MLRFLFPLLLCLMATPRWVQAQPLPDRVPFVGVAVDSEGKPLAGAIITLRRQENSGSYTFWGAVTVSDARGAFRFAQSEAGSYFLSAEMPGYAPIANQSVPWRIGSAPLRLRFERLVALRLKITAANAALPANTPLWMRLRGDGEAGQTTRRAVTEEGGEIRLEGLLPATYGIFVAAPGGFGIQNGLELRVDKAFELRLQRGGALLVTASQNTEIGRKIGGANLILTPENPAEATRALGSSADVNENVALLAAGGDTLSLVSREGDGQISLSDVPPGRYLARLRVPGHAVPDPQPVTISAGETALLSFNFAPSVPDLSSLTLRLRAKSEVGAPQPPTPREWSVRVLPIDSNGVLTSAARDANPFSPNESLGRRAQSDSSGQITLFPLRVGRYRVFVAPRTPPGEGGEPEAASIDVDVPASGGTATFEIPQTSGQ